MAAKSGQKTVTTAGTEVALGNQVIAAPLAIKALPGNTGIMYIGWHSDGTVSSSTGFPLSASEVIIFDLVGNLSDLLLDSTVNGEGVSWLVLA